MLSISSLRFSPFSLRYQAPIGQLLRVMHPGSPYFEYRHLIAFWLGFTATSVLCRGQALKSTAVLCYQPSPGEAAFFNFSAALTCVLLKDSHLLA